MNWEPDPLPRSTGWKFYIQAFLGMAALTILFLWANSLDEEAMRRRMNLPGEAQVTQK